MSTLIDCIIDWNKLNMIPTKEMTEDDYDTHFSAKRLLHNNVIDRVRNDDLDCGRCGTDSVDIYEALLHEIKCYNRTEKPSHLMDILSAMNIEKYLPKKQYQCNLCDKYFKNSYLLKQHKTRGKNAGACINRRLHTLIMDCSESQKLEVKNLIDSFNKY